MTESMIYILAIVATRAILCGNLLAL